MDSDAKAEVTRYRSLALASYTNGNLSFRVRAPSTRSIAVGGGGGGGCRLRDCDAQRVYRTVEARRDAGLLLLTTTTEDEDTAATRHCCMQEICSLATCCLTF